MRVMANNSEGDFLIWLQLPFIVFSELKLKFNIVSAVTFLYFFWGGGTSYTREE